MRLYDVTVCFEKRNDECDVSVYSCDGDGEDQESTDMRRGENKRCGGRKMDSRTPGAHSDLKISVGEFVQRDVVKIGKFHALQNVGDVHALFPPRDVLLFYSCRVGKLLLRKPKRNAQILQIFTECHANILNVIV